MAELVYDLLVMGLGGAFQNLLTGFGHDLLLQNADFSQFLPALPPQTTEFSSLNSREALLENHIATFHVSVER